MCRRPCYFSVGSRDGKSAGERTLDRGRFVDSRFRGNDGLGGVDTDKLGESASSQRGYSMEVGKRGLTDSPAQGNPKTKSVAEPFSLKSAYGSVKAAANPEDFDKISLIAKDEKAEKTVRELSE